MHLFVLESVRKLKAELEPQQIQLLAAEDCVKNKATNIRVAMAKHHRIIADIRTLLKTMVKVKLLIKTLVIYICNTVSVSA